MFKIIMESQVGYLELCKVDVMVTIIQYRKLDLEMLDLLKFLISSVCTYNNKLEVCFQRRKLPLVSIFHESSFKLDLS